MPDPIQRRRVMSHLKLSKSQPLGAMEPVPSFRINACHGNFKTTLEKTRMSAALVFVNTFLREGGLFATCQGQVQSDYRFQYFSEYQVLYLRITVEPMYVYLRYGTWYY